MARADQAWTADDLLILHEAVRLKLTLGQIMPQLPKRTKTGIRKKLWEKGWRSKADNQKPGRAATDAEKERLACHRAKRSAAAGWTDERRAEIARLHAEGHSHIAIAKLMGVTPNAVTGQVRRQGLPSRPSPIVRMALPDHAARARIQAEHRAKATAAPVRRPAVEPRAVVTSQVDRPLRLGTETCCWPLGKRLSCEALALHRKPYCAEHQRLSVADKSKYAAEEAA